MSVVWKGVPQPPPSGNSGVKVSIRKRGSGIAFLQITFSAAFQEECLGGALEGAEVGVQGARGPDGVLLAIDLKGKSHAIGKLARGAACLRVGIFEPLVSDKRGSTGVRLASLEIGELVVIVLPKSFEVRS